MVIRVQKKAAVLESLACPDAVAQRSAVGRREQSRPGGGAGPGAAIGAHATGAAHAPTLHNYPSNCAPIGHRRGTQAGQQVIDACHAQRWDSAGVAEEVEQAMSASGHAPCASAEQCRIGITDGVRQVRHCALPWCAQGAGACGGVPPEGAAAGDGGGRRGSARVGPHDQGLPRHAQGASLVPLFPRPAASPSAASMGCHLRACHK